MDLLTDERHTKRRDAVAEVLERRSVEHFSPWELYELDHPDWPFDRDYPPPTGLAENIGLTVQIADEIRDRWGGIVDVVSGWRPVTYNDLLKNDDSDHTGAEDSQHLYFRALDLSPREPKSENYATFVEHSRTIVEEYRNDGYILGFGTYPTFVHVDTGRYYQQRNWNNRA